MDYSSPGSPVHGIFEATHWSGLSFHSLWGADLPNPGIEPESPALTGKFFTTESPGRLFLNRLSKSFWRDYVPGEKSTS